MQQIDSSILFSFISMFLFGVNVILIKTAKGIDPIALTAVSVSTAAVIIALYWFVFHQQKIVSFEGLSRAVLTGLVYSLSIVLLVMAITKGQASIVSSINALSAAVAAILAIIFLSEHITFFQALGILFAVVGAILLSFK